MNRDAIERSLRQPGPLEDAYRPIAVPTHVADARRAHGWRGSLLAVGQAGAVVAAIAGGTALAILLTHSSPPGGNGVGAGVPTPTQVASSAPASGGACTADDFAWSTDPWGAAAGSRGTTVVARGVTSLAGCEIRGSASLELKDGSGTTLLSGTSAPSTVSVHAGTLLEIGITWSNWCGSVPTGPLALSLTLPGDTLAVPVIASQGDIVVPPCLGAGQPSALGATDFQPSSRATPEG